MDDYTNIVIGEMTYDSYDSDRDPRGDIGRALVEARLREVGGWDGLERALRPVSQTVSAPAASAPGPDYKGFLQRAYEARPSEFTFCTDEKRRLLKKYFPGRFRADGQQPLEDYSDSQIGALFQKLVNSAENILDRYKHETL
ncbi:hypothetical protein HYZ97_04710 [Candidatus Pacearchaeota archaeon]|nr:hypothetical protein [Candidatus Pacearchaeota archaeon]